MELKYLFRLFLKWLWLLLLIPAVSGGIVYYLNVYKAVPVYEATTTLYVVKDNKVKEDPILSKNLTLEEQRQIKLSEIYGDISVGQQAVKNYIEIIKSRSLLIDAVNSLGYGSVSIDSLVNNISINQSDKNSFVIGITVKHVNPSIAKEVSDKLASIFSVKVNSLMNTRVVDILDKAELPNNPINDKTKKNVAIAILAGLVFSLSIVLFVEYFKFSMIINDTDVQVHLELPVLANIPLF